MFNYWKNLKVQLQYALSQQQVILNQNEQSDIQLMIDKNEKEVALNENSLQNYKRLLIIQYSQIVTDLIYQQLGNICQLGNYEILSDDLKCQIATFRYLANQADNINYFKKCQKDLDELLKLNDKKCQQFISKRAQKIFIKDFLIPQYQYYFQDQYHQMISSKIKYKPQKKWDFIFKCKFQFKKKKQKQTQNIIPNQKSQNNEQQNFQQIQQQQYFPQNQYPHHQSYQNIYNQQICQPYYTPMPYQQFHSYNYCPSPQYHPHFQRGNSMQYPPMPQQNNINPYYSEYQNSSEIPQYWPQQQLPSQFQQQYNDIIQPTPNVNPNNNISEQEQIKKVTDSIYQQQQSIMNQQQQLESVKQQEQIKKQENLDDAKQQEQSQLRMAESIYSNDNENIQHQIQDQQISQFQNNVELIQEQQIEQKVDQQISQIKKQRIKESIIEQPKSLVESIVKQNIKDLQLIDKKGNKQLICQHFVLGDYELEPNEIDDQSISFLENYLEKRQEVKKSIRQSNQEQNLRKEEVAQFILTLNL